MKQIILASTSPRRKELLQSLGLKFKTVSSDYEENMTLKMEPKKLAKFLSKGKADAVVDKYKNSIIITADTFVVLNNKLLGKPKSINDAKLMLQKISGKKLWVLTGFTVVDTDTKKEVSKVVEVDVYIKKLTSQEISNYIKTKEPLDKAGAFAVQGIGSVIIKRIDGDYFGCVGLPLYGLSKVLKDFGVNIL